MTCTHYIFVRKCHDGMMGDANKNATRRRGQTSIERNCHVAKIYLRRQLQIQSLARCRKRWTKKRWKERESGRHIYTGFTVHFTLLQLFYISTVLIQAEMHPFELFESQECYSMN